MIFIDTDIFVIDKLFPNDNRYKINKAFLDESKGRSTSIFNLFEMLGIASFNLNEVELMKLFKGFGSCLRSGDTLPLNRFHLGE